MRLGFAGIGVMGAPLAGHLAHAGHEVSIFNRTTAKALEWALKYPGQVSVSKEEWAKDRDALILCVGRDSDVNEVVSAALKTAQPGTIFIDHTTTSAQLAREMDLKARAAGCYFVDAPVSGGQAGAENGALSLMVGCEAEIFARVTEITQPYTKAITRIGEVGAGQLTKMVNQICIAGVVQGLAEALHFAECANLDTEKVFHAISQGAAGSWQMSNRWATMARGEYDFGFAVDWMRKDLGITLEESSRNSAKLDLTRLIDGYYSEVQGLGGARWDTSSLKARLPRT